MFDTNSSFGHLDTEARDTLVELLEHRQEYFAHQAELYRLRLTAVTNPSDAATQAVQEYSATYIAPLREAMVPQVGRLMEEAINIDVMKTMLPMVLAALAQSVDIPLALTTLGLDPDMISTLVTTTQEYFRGGLS